MVNNDGYMSAEEWAQYWKGERIAANAEILRLEQALAAAENALKAERKERKDLRQALLAQLEEHE